MTTHTHAAVLVLAAGSGTRMRSQTPKVLHTLGGRSMIAHTLHAVAALTPDHIVVVVGHGREQVSAEVRRVTGDSSDVTTVVQEEQLGTGHAVGVGLSVLPEDFTGTVVVTTADIPLLDSETLVALTKSHAGAGVTVVTTTLPDPTGYGRIIRDADGAVAAIVEHADADEDQRAVAEINSGLYAFDAAALRSALSRLRTDNAQGELYLTDAIALIRADGLAVRAQHIADPTLVSGVNDRVQLAALGAELNRRIIERHQRAGVTVTDPTTTWIDVDVEIGPDTVIAPGTQLLGATSIGSGCTIGPDTTLTSMEIGDGATVIRTHAELSVIGDRATVGPFTYLRPGTQLGTGGKLGTFVETKNAVIGAGTKVPHLTYVGDADIGEHSNIGASSVFVNYDGENKSRTTIGSHVRTGSDTMFVAPVTIGDGAYTGAGTVVRDDVPPGALAVSAGPQRNIEDWVLRKRPGSASAQAAAKAKQAESGDPRR
ncbi:UDP-N-acetylglucosamine diphosphorylase/glucosamine-1-phosphate N-acetyltransferase [Mycolicibacterium sphagni]|uniref:Bifunctional protein GlmU n=2 Tax=Mycolicibacterium sphagni TaxID=1786 RepID=A0A255DID6_9MYCO|nr:bifunctional UDP-N-acetylglucosamine diphosphorylase/glucosamine-1-phosphate N-acetyltransferase GlmU [Mycolicibacterium sphagni]OYN79239.1 UDP-N-acetylglucosamine diphosphorylase/glucosamine-1-phosphate N-acetyltransferase [Mycolicibacterium sphagni]